MIATPGTRGIRELIITISRFQPDVTLFTQAAVTATPNAQIAFKIKLLIWIFLPSVIKNARIHPTAAETRVSFTPPPKRGANPTGTRIVARLYTATEYCFPLICFNSLYVSSTVISPLQYLLDISFTCTIRCIFVPRS